MVWQQPLNNDSQSQYRSRSSLDIEKSFYRYSEDEPNEYYDDRSYSQSSSRSASSSQGMLGRAFPSRPSRRLLRFPNSIMRWLCWGVALGIVFFIMSLVKMSWNADRDVRIAAAKNRLAIKPPLWESFPYLKRYWGGLRTLVPYTDNISEYPGESDRAGLARGPTHHKRSLPESVGLDPYPEYASLEYVQEYGKKIDCFLDADRKAVIPKVRVYKGRTEGFPSPVIGSNVVIGLQDDICYDRFGRLGPYGLGYSKSKGGSGAMLSGEREGAEEVWQSTPQVDFTNVTWKSVQDRCFLANKHRFDTSTKPPLGKYRTAFVGEGVYEDEKKKGLSLDSFWKPSDVQVGKARVQRSAVVIRTWHDFDYSTEDLAYLRSLISELNVLSGGEYDLHFLIHVRNNDASIWTDDEVYDTYLNNSLPAEFHGMGTLWTEKQMEFLYPNIQETWERDMAVHGVYRSSFMAMQYFAYQHPEYDHFWNWEMDVRNTGHWYHLFDNVSKWAKRQPRKYLWERNSRFYIPTTHGSWDEFNHTVRIQTDHGTDSPHDRWSAQRSGTSASAGMVQSKGDAPIWGPHNSKADNIDFDEDPQPVTTFDNDRYEWGVGEDADLITFNPMFDPEGTTWVLRDDTTGYKVKGGSTPRRAAIITASRLSRKLLLTMHRETSKNQHTMFSEMWPASCALQHGLKAVYAPHAEYIERKWPLEYLEATFNAGRNGATGASRMSIFGEREHNFAGTTWYYNAEFPEKLWHRWLGMESHQLGGETFEMEGEGRMCLPAMLLHPIKRVNIPVTDS